MVAGASSLIAVGRQEGLSRGPEEMVYLVVAKSLGERGKRGLPSEGQECCCSKEEWTSDDRDAPWRQPVKFHY